MSTGIPVDGRRSTRCSTSPVPRARRRTWPRPLETLAVGSEGTRHALELARVHGARFLLASTSEIYGDPLVHPQPETYLGNVNSVGPRSVYDEAKRFAEAITMAYHREFALDTKIVRIFNTYGPRMAPGRRPRRHQLPRASPRRRAAHGVRRRQPDPFVLLGRRRSARLRRAARVGLDRADEPRQPRRVHRARAGRRS